MSPQSRPYATTVSELPPYRALLAVDVKDFSGLPGRHHAAVTEEIPRILRDAFTRAGIGDIWDDRLFNHSTGDGLAAGFRSAVLPFLLNPLLPALQDELSYRNRVGGVDTAEEPIRMRVSITVGPVTGSGSDDISEGSGSSRIEVHRLLDAEPVKDILARSGATTCVAAIVSARAYEDAVLSGYTGEDQSLYVAAPVQVKKYQGTAYLRVPQPSGDLIAHGFLPRDAGAQSLEPRQHQTAKAEDAPTVNPRTIGAVHNHGTIYQTENDNRVTNDNRIIGAGSIHGPIHSTINRSTGPLNTGSGNQINYGNIWHEEHNNRDR